MVEAEWKSSSSFLGTAGNLNNDLKQFVVVVNIAQITGAQLYHSATLYTYFSLVLKNSDLCKIWDVREKQKAQMPALLYHVEQTCGAATEYNSMLAAHFQEHSDSLAQWEENGKKIIKFLNTEDLCSFWKTPYYHCSDPGKSWD